ncbi:MAG TPA: efflux RND transporter periplasmic adaptor subunit [Bacteroidetes bacterium]|nr:efflux RND transporter periplasmic adaptor subunit [Bacteroidota bacterium]
MAKSKKKKYILPLIIVVIIILAVMKSCGVFGSNEKIDQVDTQQATTATIVQIVTASGKIKPSTEVKIAPEVSGEITQLTVKEGDEVKKGQLLVQIKQDIYISAVNRAQAAVQQSIAALEQSAARLKESESEYKRSKLLFESGTIARADWEATEANYKVARLTYDASKSSLESARATLKEAEDNLMRTQIFAPIDGTISQLNVEAGERVVGTAQMAGTEVLRVANLDSMEVEVTVGENDIVKLAVGNPVDIEVDAYWGKRFKGRVTEIASSAANVTETSSADQVTNFNVKIIILDESYRDLVEEKNLLHTPFKPGMTASVEIESDRKDSILVAPIRAVSTRQVKDSIDGSTRTREVVFVLQDGKALQKEVETGIQDDENIEILHGIEPGETLITGPYSLVSKTLHDGQSVKVSEKKKK